MVAGAAAAASDILARIDAKGLISDSLQTVVSVANRVDEGWGYDGVGTCQSTYQLWVGGILSG